MMPSSSKEAPNKPVSVSSALRTDEPLFLRSSTNDAERSDMSMPYTGKENHI
jgi:hypothetical protein